MKKLADMPDESLMRVIRHLRKVKEDLIKNYEKLLSLETNEDRMKEIKAEIFFLKASDVQNVSKSGKVFYDEADRRGLI